MYNVYVLQSSKNKKRYVGFTSKTVAERLKEHNSGSNSFTRQNKPFEVIYSEEYDNKSFAQKRERFLKSGHGRNFLKRKLAEHLFPCSSVGRAGGCEQGMKGGGNWQSAIQGLMKIAANI
ncbi:MAG: GIY-YIG nuclease family protein [Candidatus Omnitrophota bacterium]